MLYTLKYTVLYITYISIKVGFFKFQERRQRSALDSDMTKYLELSDRELKISVISMLRAQWKSEQCAGTDDRWKLKV